MEELKEELKKELVKTEKFKVENKRFLLTYKTHLDKKAYEMWLENKRPCDEIYIAHEYGTDDPVCPYEHTHVAVNFTNTLKTTMARYFDYEGIHPNIAPVKGSNWRQQWKKVKMYVSKEDESLKHLREEIIEEEKKQKKTVNLDKLLSHKTLADAIRDPEVGVRNWGHIGGVTMAYGMKKIEIKKKINCLHKWQVDIKEIIMGEIDDRKVYWIYDPIGQGGKTQFCKMMMAEDCTKFWMVTNASGSRDFGHAVSNAFNAGWTGHCMLFNLSREVEEYNIYGPMEMMKDGVLTTTKFNSRTMIWDSSHVVVMANFMPDYSKLSRDRWVVWKLSGGGDYTVLHNIKSTVKENKTECDL